MLKVEELSKSFRTEEIETIALNKVSFEVASSSLSWVPRAAANLLC